MIERIQSLCNDGAVIITGHAENRIKERGITYGDIVTAIANGVIIEKYPTDYPNPSVLIFGQDKRGNPLHIVVGIGSERLWVITAYQPSIDKWENDWKTRKRVR